MLLVPYAKFNIKTSLSKKVIIEILSNSIDVEGLASKRKFISGEVTGNDFRIKTRGKIIPHEAGSGLIQIEGKILEEANGCAVELIISYGRISLILAASALFIIILLSFLSHFLPMIIILIYLLIVVEFNMETKDIKTNICHLLEASEFHK